MNTNIREWEDEQNVHLEAYKGIPKQFSKKEKSSWDKFKEFIFPWLNEKRKLGERFLLATIEDKEAEALKKKSEAFKNYADGTLKIEQAKKIAKEAEQIEIEKSREFDNIDINDEMRSRKIDELENKLRAYSAIYGLRIDIKKSLEKQNENNEMQGHSVIVTPDFGK